MPLDRAGIAIADADPEMRSDQESSEAMEGARVEGVTATSEEAKVNLRLPDDVGVHARLFGPLAQAGIVVDVIVQVPGEDGTVHLSFTTPMSKLMRAVELLRQSCADICPPGSIDWKENLSKVSLIGIGMRSHAGVALKMFELLGQEQIAIDLVSTSEIRIACLVDGRDRDRAVRALRQGFGLGA
jgi:aspartate kinase